MASMPSLVRWSLLALPLLIVLTFGCDPAPTATPEPTPTPTPTPTLEPILIDPKENPREFLLALPGAEQQCIRNGIDPVRLEQVLEISDTTETEDRVFLECISQETLVRIMVGSFARLANPLSQETMDCLWNTLGEADLSPAFDMDKDGEPSLAFFLPFINASLCFSAEEVARIQTTTDGDFPIAEMYCLAQRIDLEQLPSLFLDGMEGLPPAEIVSAMLDCGLEMEGRIGEDHPFTEEQLVCLSEALGDEGIEQFFGQDGDPPFEALLAILECVLEMEGYIGEDPLFTAEQLVCLSEALGDEGLEQFFGQDGDPPFEAIIAILACGLSLDDLSGD